MVIKGDTRSLDYSSYIPYNPLKRDRNLGNSQGSYIQEAEEVG